MERLARICASVRDATALRVALVDELRRAIGFDAYGFVLTDPMTSVGSAPLADVPCVEELPELIRLKYLTPVNRWTALDDPPTALLGDPARSLLWRELLHRYSVGDIASTVFRDPFGCWGFLDLWRSTPFTADEAGLLAAAAPAITRGLRAAQAATFLSAPVQHQRSGPVVLLLDPRLRVLGQTGETQAYLRMLVPPAPARDPIPAGAYNVGAQLLAREAGVDPRPARARVHLGDGLWLTLRAARLEENIAVTIEQASPAERADVFARAFGLTPRETQVLDQLATGDDNRQIAARLFLSEHTVQDHLKSVFAKTSLRSRRALIAHAFGLTTLR
ncbi:LuxR C-terminal-related transcriptional regulator [Nonomuraea sp. NPDC050556]|uniref:helix-turn-helix transcriptional regulator n=1 Tax=Nonomuraea sp. NPDC050556 TaxID=3364369 RepID=UPI0037AB2FED